MYLSEQQRRVALGIDLGGTAIKVGVVTHQGEIIGHAQVATEVNRGVSGVVANMARAARDAMQAAGVNAGDLEGVGIGAPGICNGPEGVVVDAVNLGWKNVPVAELLHKELGMSVFLDNDANCAALGEQWCGAARGSDHMMLLTIGTGVGGGLILNGKIYQGFSGWAAEFGHMPAVADGPLCNCGRRGCVETVASATAIANAARKAIEAGKAPVMAAMAKAQDGHVDARLVITAARDGDQVAIEVLRQAGVHLGNAVAALVSALNPELVVVGGGASKAGAFLLDPLYETVQAKAMPGPASVVKVVEAQLGNDAGLIGAASLVWR